MGQLFARARPAATRQHRTTCIRANLIPVKILRSCTANPRGLLLLSVSLRQLQHSFVYSVSMLLDSVFSLHSIISLRSLTSLHSGLLLTDLRDGINTT